MSMNSDELFVLLTPTPVIPAPASLSLTDVSECLESAELQCSPSSVPGTTLSGADTDHSALGRAETVNTQLQKSQSAARLSFLLW